jgi:4-carboxymuconolactone decarboxylase
MIGSKDVDAGFANADAFSIAIQEYITEHVYGAVWARRGLDLKTRSLVTVAMVAALGIHTEVAAHVRGALRNGATAVEIRETLLQVAVYAGAPRAFEAFDIAHSIVGTQAK